MKKFCLIAALLGCAAILGTEVEGACRKANRSARSQVVYQQTTTMYAAPQAAGGCQGRAAGCSGARAAGCSGAQAGSGCSGGRGIFHGFLGLRNR